MSLNAILIKDFDVSQVNFDVLTKNKLGGKLVRLSYGPNKQPIRIQTPEMYIPFDPSHHDDSGTIGPDGNKIVNFTFEVALNGFDDPNSRVKDFYEKMVALDDKIAQTCVERSADWLGEVKKREVVDEFHRKLVRHKNPKYSPLMKVKVTPIRTDGTLPKVFSLSGTEHEELDLGVIAKGVRAKYILAIQSVWFVNKTFGLTAKLVQAAVTHRPSATMNGYAFMDDDDDQAPASSRDTPADTGRQYLDADLDI